MFKYLRRILPDSEIPSEARMLGLAILLVNIPSFVSGLLAFWILIPIPGLILYGFGIALVCNKLSLSMTELITILTMLYHLVLMIFLISILFQGVNNISELINWTYITAMPFSTICFGVLLLRTINEAKTPSYEKA